MFVDYYRFLLIEYLLDLGLRMNLIDNFEIDLFALEMFFALGLSSGKAYENQPKTC